MTPEQLLKELSFEMPNCTYRFIEEKNGRYFFEQKHPRKERFNYAFSCSKDGHNRFSYHDQRKLCELYRDYLEAEANESSSRNPRDTLTDRPWHILVEIRSLEHKRDAV